MNDLMLCIKKDIEQIILNEYKNSQPFIKTYNYKDKTYILFFDSSCKILLNILEFYIDDVDLEDMYKEIKDYIER